MFSLKLTINLRQDAWNRWEACNRISHGKDWKKSIDPQLAEKITWKTKEEAFEFLIPYLADYYHENNDMIQEKLQQWQALIDQNIDAACRKMEQLTWYPLYRNDFTWYFTSFPRWPYNLENGTIHVIFKSPIEFYLQLFLHELLHFQCIYYYKDVEPMSELTNSQFEFLKESLTFLLNYEFKEFLLRLDNWYELHQDFRKELESYWLKDKSFTNLIAYWVQEVKKYID